MVPKPAKGPLKLPNWLGAQKAPKEVPQVSDWGDLQMIGDRKRYIKMSLYGKGKTGKTRLAATFPKPLLLFAMEDGTDSLVEDPGIQMKRIDSSDTLDRMLDDIRLGRAPKEYATLVLDTASDLQDLIFKEVLGLPEVPQVKEWGMARKQDWGRISANFKRIVAKLLDLQAHVVVIAHERAFVPDEERENKKALPTFIGSALTEGSCNWLNGKANQICQTFIKNEVVKKTSIYLGKKVVTEEETGNRQFCLRVGPHEVYTTGFRCPIGSFLPEIIVDPTFEKVYEIAIGKAVQGA